MAYQEDGIDEDSFAWELDDPVHPQPASCRPIDVIVIIMIIGMG